MLSMDDSWKADNGTHSQSPSPVPSLVNRSNASISLSSIEPPPQPTTQVNLEVYERTTASASSAVSSSFGSFNFEFDSIELDNDFLIDVPVIPNSATRGNDDLYKETKPMEKLFFGLFKHRCDKVYIPEQDNTPKTLEVNGKQVKRKHSLACLNFFKKEQTQKNNQLQTDQYPKKSILKSKVNQNYTIEQSQTKIEDSLSFSQFMDRFEHVESEKIGNEEKLSMLRSKQLKDYYSQLDGS
ncbi:hypothetical protein K4I79_000833 [Candida tropicalis]